MLTLSIKTQELSELCIWKSKNSIFLLQRFRFSKMKKKLSSETKNVPVYTIILSIIIFKNWIQHVSKLKKNDQKSVMHCNCKTLSGLLTFTYGNKLYATIRFVFNGRYLRSIGRFIFSLEFWTNTCIYKFS